MSLINESISYCLMRCPKIGIRRGPPFNGVAQKNGLINVVEDPLAITDAVAFCSTGDVYKRQIIQ